MKKYKNIASLFGIRTQDNRKRSVEENQRSIIGDNTPFVIRESYKTARTNIIFSVSGMLKEGCKTIVMTSANPGEGKTTTTLNLALTFAQTGARVLAIDCDLRKPRMHRYIGIKKNIGISSILSKQVTIDEAIHKNVRLGLDVIASGEIPPNPAELLASESMKALIEELSKRYDYIFFDTPPVTVVTDASALSTYVDGVIVVVRQNYTDHESLAMGVDLLNIAKAKILGFFINDVQSQRGGGYRYRYGYKYSYRYGYKYDYHYTYGDLSTKKIYTGEGNGEDADEDGFAKESDSKKKK